MMQKKLISCIDNEYVYEYNGHTYSKWGDSDGQYYSLVIKTNNDSHAGHDWVVITSCHRKWSIEPLSQFKDIYDGRESLHPLNCMIVKPCQDCNSKLGSLLCDDEFNVLSKDDIDYWTENRDRLMLQLYQNKAEEDGQILCS